MVIGTSKISSKGQVVIPLEIRKHLGLQEGDSIKFVVDDDGMLQAKIIKKSDLMSLNGIVKAKGDTSNYEKVRREAYEERSQRRTTDDANA
jgi:antitoxin PrlF